MHLLRGVRAEWPLLRIRLLRTRLGLWLALLGAASLWLARAPAPPDRQAMLAQAGALAAVLCVGYLAGSGADRRAIILGLSHPTTPGALALGRWAATVGGAALVVLALAAHMVWTTGAVAASLGGALAGLVTAAAVGACGLALAWTGGNVLAAVFFVWLALLGSAPPELLLGMRHPGAVRVALAALLEIAPAPWRYRGVATGDPGALLHATLWVAVGLAVARRQVVRLSRASR